MSYSQIQIRRGTLSEWAAANPVLLAGEMGFATDAGLFKVGDGATAWNSLRWAKRSMQVTQKALSSAGYTILDDDGCESIECSTGASDRTITLPTAADNVGREVELIKTDSGAGYAILDGEGTEKIGLEGNALTFTLYAQGDRVRVRSNGTLWKVISTNGPVIEYSSSSDVSITSPNSGTWYNPTSHSISLDPGKWDLSFEVDVYAADSGSTSISPQAAMSTSNSSVSDQDLRGRVYAAGFASGSLILIGLINRTKPNVVIAASTTYYLIIEGESSGGGGISLQTRGASDGSTKIRARRIG